MRKIMWAYLMGIFLNGCITSQRSEIRKEDLLRSREEAHDSSFIQYARGFDLIQEEHFRILKVFDPWQNSPRITFSYVLGSGHHPVPDSLKDLPYIQTPVERVIALSTTHLAMLEMLGVTESIAGVSGSNLVYSSSIAKQIAEGEVLDVGYSESLNFETIVSLDPDVLFIYGVESSVRTISDKLTELGISSVYCAEYLESHPLGKAEWIRFFSLFFEMEEKADLLFHKIDSSYHALSRLAMDVEDRPLVLTGLPWKDTWYMAGGNSYAAKLIEDAGGAFLWDHNESTQALPLDLESVFTRAMDADIWINPGAAKSIRDLETFDERFAALPVLKSGKIYNNNARTNLTGANDYWESGTVRPDLILADLIKVFHPDIMRDHRYIYYRELK